MSWTDELLQASYRNLSFYISSDNVIGGKRGKVWEYPFSDKSYTQVLGKKTKKFNIEGYLIGEDFITQKRNFIQTIDDTDEGKLVHPTLGIIQVKILDYNFSDNKREGRLCRFTLQCVESGELNFPIVKLDPTTATSIQKEKVYNTLISTFVNIYTILTAPSSVSQNAIDNVDKVLDYIQKSKSTVDTVAEFNQKIETLKGRVVSLTYDSQELAQNLTELTQFGTNKTDEEPVTVENSEENFNNMRSIMEYTPENVISSDPLSADNQIIFLVQLSGTISACTLLTIMEYDSYESSLDFRDIAINKLDTFLETVTDENLYLDLYDLRTKVIKDLEQRVDLLPRISKLNLMENKPAIVLSHELYGTIEYEQDIVDRNQIENPAFIPALVDLEVLVYA